MGRQGVDPLKVGAATGLHGVLSSKSLTTMVCMVFKIDNSKWYKWGPFESKGVQILKVGATTGLHGVFSSKSLTTMVCMVFKMDNSQNSTKGDPLGRQGLNP